MNCIVYLTNGRKRLWLWLLLEIDYLFNLREAVVIGIFSYNDHRLLRRGDWRKRPTATTRRQRAVSARWSPYGLNLWIANIRTDCIFDPITEQSRLTLRSSSLNISQTKKLRKLMALLTTEEVNRKEVFKYTQRKENPLSSILEVIPNAEFMFFYAT